MRTYSVVIPMYNEANRIQPTLADIVTFRQVHQGVVGEVILVDDGSKDATVERCVRYQGVFPLKIIALSENSGKWAAINAGVDVAKYDDIMIIDADNSATVWNVVYVNEDVAFGSRFSSQSKVVGKSFLRTVVSHCYKMYVRFWYFVGGGRCKIEDMQCPFKVFKKSLVAFPVESVRFCGDLDFALRIPRGVRVQNIPIRFEHKRGGSINMEAAVGMLLQTPRVAWKSYVKRWKSFNTQ